MKVGVIIYIVGIATALLLMSYLPFWESKWNSKIRTGDMTILRTLPQPEVGDIRDGCKVIEIKFEGICNPYKQHLMEKDLIYNYYTYKYKKMNN